MAEAKSLTGETEVDVVVAGAGGAGIAAAIELAQAHASVIVLEKQASIEESSSSLCGGVYTFAGTDFQHSRGIQDSDGLLFQDLMAVGQQKNDERLVRAYVDNQLDTYRWMTDFGVKWVGIEALAGMSVPRGHVTDPAETLRILKRIAEKAGARFFFETPVTGLVIRAGKVTGVTAEAKGKGLTIKASRGVLLATGGFGRDPQRLAAIDPHLPKVVPVVGAGHTGDGHRMAEELGAAFRDLEYVKPTFGIHYLGNDNHSLSMIFYNGGIIVNKEGKRFIDESRSYKDLGKASVAQTESIGYQIFDQKIFDAAVERVRGLPREKALWGLEESRIRLLIKAETLGELAAKAGLPPAVLEDTVARYNRDVAAGRDSDFGRTALAGGAGNIVPIATPSFYCYPSRSVLPGTYGGIVVDESLRVIGKSGPVPGLYAAGEIVGGFHGASYMSGTAVGKAVIFGRIVGRNLARA